MEGTVIIQFTSEETVVQGDREEFSQGHMESFGARIRVQTCLTRKIMEFLYYFVLHAKETVPPRARQVYVAKMKPPRWLSVSTPWAICSE